MDKALTIFPFQADSKGLLFPVIPVRFHFQDKTIDSSALIDSGATVSIFRTDVAQHLNITVENGEETFLGGVGGHIKGYLHRLVIEVAGKKFLCPVVFSHEYLVSFNLLGRQEFFPRFRILFDEKKKLVRLN